MEFENLQIVVQGKSNLNEALKLLESMIQKTINNQKFILTPSDYNQQTIKGNFILLWKQMND